MLLARNLIAAFRTLLDLSLSLPITRDIIVGCSLIGIHVAPGDLSLAFRILLLTLPALLKHEQPLRAHKNLYL